jgi:hypothetical protein
MQRSVHVTTYPEYTTDHKTWKSPRPAFDVERFNKELEKRAGCIGTIPRFRLRWAGEHAEYIVDEGLVHTGFSYIVDGKENFVPLTEPDFEFPDDALLINPFYEDFKVFTPRWVIEEYQPEALAYWKAWFVEEISQEVAEGEGGRIDVVSYYRQPAEIDLQMAERLNYLRNSLNQDDIANGLAELKKLSDRAQARKKDEFVNEIAEETARAFTDGIAAKPINFDLGKNFDIREHTKKKIEEFNAKA